MSFIKRERASQLWTAMIRPWSGRMSEEITAVTSEEGPEGTETDPALLENKGGFWLLQVHRVRCTPHHATKPGLTYALHGGRRWILSGTVNVSCNHTEVGCKVTAQLDFLPTLYPWVTGVMTWCLAEGERQLGSLYANSKVKCWHLEFGLPSLQYGEKQSPFVAFKNKLPFIPCRRGGGLGAFKIWPPL